MRTIKFRAWDKWKKKMIQPNNGDFIGWHAMSNWKDCLEVMQFTGLTDKNGKEIYEGDIVDVLNKNQKYNGTTLIVTFEDGCFCLRTKDTTEFRQAVGLRQNIVNARNKDLEDPILEIIGNIHENTIT